MSTLINYIWLIGFVSILVFVRVIADMQRARNMAFESLSKLNTEIKQAKLDLSRVPNLSEHPQKESYLQFLVTVERTYSEMLESKEELVRSESKLSYFKRLSSNQSTWLKMAQSAELHYELLMSNAKSFRLVARV